MIPDRLILTAEGEQAMLNAEQGSVFIRPKSFKVGDYSGANPSTVPSDLLGTVVSEGRLHYVEVQSKKTVVFTVVVPAVFGSSQSLISEAIVMLDDAVTLGYVRFANPIIKYPNEAITIEFMLHLTQSNAHVIDVTLSEFGSVPTVANVDYLPPAVSSITNVIAVLDMKSNPSNSYSPGLAMRYGNGGAHWGFSNHDEVFQDRLESALIDANTISLPALVSEYGLKDGSTVIVSVYSGAGAGETRRFSVVANGNFVATNLGFSALTGSSVVSVWIPVTPIAGGGTGGTGGGSGLPSRDGVGADWVLAAGMQTGKPLWVPIAGGKSRTRGNLFHPAGKLSIQAVSITPTESKRSYVLYEEDPTQTNNDESQIHLYSYRKNNNYLTVALSGVYQNRSSFEVSNNVIEFPEYIPADVDIDAWLYELQPHTGMYTSIKPLQIRGDGTTRRFLLPDVVESLFYLRVIRGRVLISTSAYLIDPVTNEIVFTEPPMAGERVQVDCFVQNPVEGYSTQVQTVSIKISTTTNIIILPFSPQDKEQVFIYEQALALYKDEYTIVGNKIVASTNFQAGNTVEVMIFNNILAEGTADTGLRGMVTDVVHTSKGLEFIRHAMPSVRVASHEISIEAGEGISIEGESPNFKITSLVASKANLDKVAAIMAEEKAEDISEITITRRINYVNDVVLTVTADFDASLGPGFVPNGTDEGIQFTLSIVPAGAKDIEYGKSQRGSGEVGLSVPSPNSSGSMATATASRTLSVNITAQNSKQKYVDIIAKMRVVRSEVENTGSLLRVALNGTIIPRL